MLHTNHDPAGPVGTVERPELLGPPWHASAEAYRAEVRADLLDGVVPHITVAEAIGRFPPEVIHFLGRRGHFACRWAHPGPYGDLGRATILANEIGKLQAGGISAGTSLHGDSALGLLRAVHDQGPSVALARRAVDGDQILCIGVTEPSGGSDVTGITTRASMRPDGSWVIRGRKKFISLALTADAALVLARTGEQPARLSFFAVPRRDDTHGYQVTRVLNKHGTRSLETCELHFADVVVPAEALIGREGSGLALFSRAMTAERLALCAQLTGALAGALELARAHLRRRAARPGTLWDFQALRHRFADLYSTQRVLEAATYATAAAVQHGQAGQRDVAALKLQVAPQIEGALSEVLQLLGGTGYTDEFPVERALRDARLARIGAGTDDVMREIVSGVALPEDRYIDLMVSRAALEPDLTFDLDGVSHPTPPTFDDSEELR